MVTMIIIFIIIMIIILKIMMLMTLFFFTKESCMKVNMRVTGTSVDIFKDIEGFNLCESYCRNTPGCYYWAWNPQQECELVGSDGLEEQKQNYISGKYLC